ncbi:hypothetical protein LCGC14_1204630 [marine sediment metagenome]|uniref:Uncharacterized protein n=1 Tax=marine sediment metagenome TaxID=412755 RepID=A0A0F9LK99_9ZZZZ
MKTRLFTYVHESNGLSLEIVPETDTEAELLAALWKHGRMETSYSSDNKDAKSYQIRVFAEDPQGESPVTPPGG